VLGLVKLFEVVDYQIGTIKFITVMFITVIFMVIIKEVALFVICCKHFVLSIMQFDQVFIKLCIVGLLTQATPCMVSLVEAHVMPDVELGFVSQGLRSRSGNIAVTDSKVSVRQELELVVVFFY